jgi:hypothetical protein
VGQGHRQPDGLRLRRARQSWFFHQLTDWIGDDGIVVTLQDSIRKFNYMGDTQFLSGR